MAKANFQTTFKERAGYNSYFAGQNMIYLLVMMFLSIYFTNTLGIPAATVGTIFLIARVWDAVNDPMLSVLVEKTTLKSGRFKPWIKSVALLMPISTVLLFSFTGWLIDQSMAVRVAYASFIYITWGMIYTVSDAPAFALATIMTDNTEERTSIISNSRFFAMIGIVGVLIIVNPIMGAVNGDWFLTSAIVSAIALVFLLGINFTKERVDARTESPTLKSIINAIIGNKFLIIYVICATIYGGSNFGQSLSAYVCTDLLGDPSLIATMGLIGMIPTLLLIPFVPQLVKRIDKTKLLKISYILIILFSIVSYFVGYDNLTFYIIMVVVKGIVAVPVMILDTLFYVDCIEYAENTTGDRFEAATFSARTFSAKAVGALSGAVGMWLLAAVGYVSSTAGEVVVQSEAALSGLWILATLSPVVGATIALIVFTKYYKLDDATVAKIMDENKQKNGNN